MPWKIRLIDRPPAVHVTVSGNLRLPLIKRLASEALAEAARRAVRRFLMDEREMVPDLSTLEIHQLPDILARLGLAKSDPVAIVYSETAPRAADFRFFENTALNRGFRLRLFTRIDDALEWLGRVSREAPQPA